MSKKQRRRISIALFSIILLALALIPFYPALSNMPGFPSLLKAQNSINQIEANSPKDKASNSNNNTATTVTANTSENNQGPKTSKPPEDSSYLMLNLRTGERLLAKNEAMRMAPASTVKLLTGILVQEKLQADKLITVGEEVKVEGSMLGLNPGDQILVSDLFTAMYVGSANDAANALAVAAYGTMDDFIKAMNQYAVKLGCTDTQFQTANGFPAPEQYTTAQDLAIIAAVFTKKKDLMDYVNKKEATIEWTHAKGWKQVRDVFNTNQLLGIYPGDLGLKTGTTTEAGQCLVTYITRPDADILLVLLGSQQRYSDTTGLLDQGLAKIRTRSALKNITSSPETLYNTPGFFVQ